jgi:predicted nucleotidyltransferase
MGQNNKEKILKIFYEYPIRKFSIREISSLTGIPRATAHNVLDILKKEKLITKENSAETSLKFRTKKINFFIEKIVESGLIDDIAEKLNPSVIILFGSIRKGDSIKESDIDLFVESALKKKLDLVKYEKKLGHKIQLFIEPDIKKLGNELANNVINGIKLFGSIKIW